MKESIISEFETKIKLFDNINLKGDELFELDIKDGEESFLKIKDKKIGCINDLDLKKIRPYLTNPNYNIGYSFLLEEGNVIIKFLFSPK